LALDQALSSHATTKNKFDAAAQDDIYAYRAWMDENAPVHPSETEFLRGDHDQDLINPSSPKHRPQPTIPNNTSDRIDLKQIVFLLYVTMVLLLLAFSMLPGFLSKLLLLVVVVASMGSILLKEFPLNYGIVKASKKDA
jgi:hypothetical protein